MRLYGQVQNQNQNQDQNQNQNQNQNQIQVQVQNLGADQYFSHKLVEIGYI